MWLEEDPWLVATVGGSRRVPLLGCWWYTPLHVIAVEAAGWPNQDNVGVNTNGSIIMVAVTPLCFVCSVLLVCFA